MTNSSTPSWTSYNTLPSAAGHVRGDRLIGALVSVGLIAGAAWLGELGRNRDSAPRAHRIDTAVKAMVMPWIEPDVPDEVPYEKTPHIDIRPPVQPDVPQRPNSDTFVQPLEAPPPWIDGNNHRLITIPSDALPVDTGRIFDPSQLDRQPAPISQTRPIYPFEMRRNGISGQVVVDFIVDVSGRVRNPYPANSTNRDFESAAVDAVAKWRFQPGRKGGHAVRTHMQVPIIFNLRDGS